jgi:hypothetical protein
MKTKQLIRYFVILFFPLFTFAFPKPDAISIFGNNPEVQVANVKTPEFEYRSLGTRTLGLGLSFEKRWFSLEATDPRDTKSGRARHTLFEFRYFSEYQWGVVISHSKNFNLYPNENLDAQQIGHSPNMEMYTSQIFVIKNSNNSELSIEDALRGISRFEHSGFVGFYGLQAFTNYLHDEGSLASGHTNGGISDINNVNSHGIGALGGLLGVFTLADFFAAAQIGFAGGTTYTSWTEKSGQGEKLNILQLNGGFTDFAFGYGPEKYSILLKFSSYSNMHNTKDYKLNTDVISSKLIFSYRF